jgi:hypothetical protein
MTRNRVKTTLALAAPMCAWAAAGWASPASLSVAGSVLAHDAAAAPQQDGQVPDPGRGHRPASPRAAAPLTGGLLPAAAAREERTAPGVTLMTMLSNSGWTVVLYFADEGIREIFYRLDQAGEFRSTGFTRMIDPKTGFRVPATFFQLPREVGRTSRHTVAVMWLDAAGTKKGPRELSFSLAEEVVQAAKQTLETLIPNDWIAFREYPKGRLLVYFTPLLSYSNALSEIRYSVDDASLSHRLPFETWTDLSTTPKGGVGDTEYMEVPLDTQSVSVQLRYLDGSESDVKTFPVRLMP